MEKKKTAKHEETRHSAGHKHHEHHQPARRKQSIVDSIILDIENARLFKIAAESCKTVCRQWPWLVLGVFLDFMFIFASGVMMTLVQLPLLGHLEALMVLAGESTGGLMNVMNQTADVAAGVGAMGTSTDFHYHINAIFKWLFVMVIAAFVIWIIFQGLAWYTAYRIEAGKKRQRLLIYWKNFLLESVPFYFVTVLMIFLSVKAVFQVKMSVTGAVSSDLVNFIFLMLVLVVWYFGTLCYSMTGRYAWQNFKQCFIYGGKRFLKTIQSYAFLFLMFLIIHLILSIRFLEGHPYFLMILGTLLFLPAVTYSRVVLFRTTREYWAMPEAQTAKKHK